MATCHFTNLRWFVKCIAIHCLLVASVFSATISNEGVRAYDIPAGDASVTLHTFAEQSGEQLVYLIDNVRGQKTHRVRGQFTALAALERMLLHTDLTIHRDGANGPMTVSRRSEPRNQVAGSAESSTSRARDSSGSDLVVLPEFTVSENRVDPYRAADAISSVRVRAALIDTPGSISVLTRDIIDDLAPTRIFDVTRYVAGVQEGRGIQFQDRMILRGFESNGQRTVDNFLQPDDADNIDEVLVDRIEIAKGPNAILSPAGAPGGALNIITKSPLFRTHRTLTALVGMFDAQKISIDLTGPFSNDSRFAYRIVGSIQDSRRYWSEDARLRGRVLAPMFAYRISERTQLTVKLVAAEHWIFREPLLILNPSVNASTRNPYLAPGLSKKGLNGIQPWSHVGTHSADLFALLTSSLTENINLRLAANGRYYFEDSTQEFLSTPNLTNRYNPATGELTQDYTWNLDPATGAYVATHSPFFDPGAIPVRGDKQATRRKTVNVQADAVARYRFGSVNSQTVVGFALSRRTNYGRGVSGTLPGVDLSTPNLRAEPIWANTWSFKNDSQFTNWQAYINQRIDLLADRVQITGGLLGYNTYTYARNHLLSAAPGILDDGKAMWMSSLLVKIRPNSSVYYSHSTNASPVIANNIALWRDGVQDEFGIKSEFFDQRLSFNAAYFEIAQTNVTVPNPDRQTDPSAPESLVSDLKNHGVELELIGGITPNLSAIVTFTELKMRDSLGRHVRAVAERNGAVLLNYRFPKSSLYGLALNLGVSYSGRRAGDTPINFTPLNAVGKTSFFLKPYYVTTLGASYRWKEEYLFRLHIDNVLDDKGYIQQAGGRVSGTGITTAPGINVKFSTTLNF
jgi:iron complex outermembrane receptor protein